MLGIIRGLLKGQPIAKSGDHSEVKRQANAANYRWHGQQLQVYDATAARYYPVNMRGYQQPVEAAQVPQSLSEPNDRYYNPAKIYGASLTIKKEVNNAEYI